MFAAIALGWSVWSDLVRAINKAASILRFAWILFSAFAVGLIALLGAGFFISGLAGIVSSLRIRRDFGPIVRRQDVLLVELAVAMVYGKNYHYLLIDRSGDMVAIRGARLPAVIELSKPEDDPLAPVDKYPNPSEPVPCHLRLHISDETSSILKIECFGPTIPVDILDEPTRRTLFSSKGMKEESFRIVRPEELPGEWRERVRASLPNA